MRTERTSVIYTHTTYYSQTMLDCLNKASTDTGIPISIDENDPPLAERVQTHDRIILPQYTSPVSVKYVNVTVYGNHVTLFQEMYRLAQGEQRTTRGLKQAAD